MSVAVTIVEAAVSPAQQICTQLNDIFDAAFVSNDPITKLQYQSDLHALYLRSQILGMQIVYDEFLGFVPQNMRGL